MAGSGHSRRCRSLRMRVVSSRADDRQLTLTADISHGIRATLEPDGWRKAAVGQHQTHAVQQSLHLSPQGDAVLIWHIRMQEKLQSPW